MTIIEAKTLILDPKTVNQEVLSWIPEGEKFKWQRLMLKNCLPLGELFPQGPQTVPYNVPLIALNGKIDKRMRRVPSTSEDAFDTVPIDMEPSLFGKEHWPGTSEMQMKILTTQAEFKAKMTPVIQPMIDMAQIELTDLHIKKKRSMASGEYTEQTDDIERLINSKESDITNLRYLLNGPKTYLDESQRYFHEK